MPSRTAGWTKLSRQELYKRMWTTPAATLAREFGVSDVGLAKICKRHNVPRPPRGYWAKTSAGQHPQQSKLPNPDNNCVIEIRESFESLNGSAPNDELRQQVEDQSGNKFRIDVRDNLRRAHPLVSQANMALEGATYDSDGIIKLPEESPLDVRVSKALLRRSLFVMDALLRSFEEHGEEIKRGPCVVLLDIPVRFAIFEAVQIRREEPESTDLSGRYQFGFRRFHSKRMPSGKLTFQIVDGTRYWSHKCRQTWRDTPKQPLENRLESILTGLVEYAVREREEADNRRREAEARAAAEVRRQEDARKQAIELAAIQAEQKRVEDLIKQSQLWRQSQTLREYIEAAKQQYRVSHGEIEPESEMAGWLKWAVHQADCLDPLTNCLPANPSRTS